VNGKAFTTHLLERFGIEVGGGLGALAGQVWRIGLMGYNSTPENVDRLLNLFETELPAFQTLARPVAATVG
jgi:alanine-glyoxylate transaminase/serine-glyoxylate transaminase/serine-pyruvate transaminase